jgi:transposase
MEKKGTERRVYTKEFKAEAVATAMKREKPVSQLAVDLGINESLLWRWLHQARQVAGSGLPPFPGHGRPRDESDFSPRWPACGKKSRRYGR